MTSDSLASRAPSPDHRPRVSVVIPCLNEAENIEECISRANAVLAENGISGEVIVADNGSDDGSAQLARAAGATVVDEPRRGYGSAYLAGFAAATGDYIIMIDADLTYDFADIPRFVQELDEGADLVMGNRMMGIQPGAMPWMNRYIGNPLLSGFLKLLIRTDVGDAHCGMRGLRRDALPILDLNSTGMEFASEMVIRAARRGLDIREFPIKLHPRGGESKLSPFRDGWRHLRLILIYSPDFVLLLPGALMILVGAVFTGLVFGEVELFGRGWYLHTLIVSTALIIIGTQLVALGLCGRTYGVYVLGDRDPLLERWQQRVRLEHGLLAGLAVLAAGIGLGIFIVVSWIHRGLGTLGEGRLAVLSVTLVVTGMQIFFTSFLLSLLGLRRRR